MDKKETPRTDEYRGVAVDKAENGKADKKDIRQDIRELNNNPRNNDIDQ